MKNVSVEVVDENNGTGVYVRITVDSDEYEFRLEAGRTNIAHAVSAFLSNALTEQIKRVRRVDYLRGYRHGRNRSAKLDMGMASLYVGEWMEKEAGL